MRLGAMQPYFFPYAQQFRHIAQCDLWILFDTPRFARKTWVSRNRILDRQTGWAYVGASVAKGQTGRPIADAELADDGWRERVLDHLRVYDGVAPHYEVTRDMVTEVLLSGARTIGELNARAIDTVCRRLAIDTPRIVLSTADVELPAQAGAGQWGLLLSLAYGADVYSNAEGGRHLFDEADFTRHGIRLEFYEPRPLRYPTAPFGFEEHLSVIDTMMWMSVDELSAFVHAPAARETALL